jgi:4-hydroxy-2-oxoheptanedioate aldolase
MLKIRTNLLKQSLQFTSHNSCQIGLWTTLRSTIIAEILSQSISGYDWFVIDMEHSPNEISDVLTQLQVSQYGKVEPVVRVPSNDPILVKRILDLGTQSILFPMINNVEEAQKAVASMRYPPHGIRGVMSLQRMNQYGACGPQYYHDAATQLCCICQIETVEGLKNIEEIAQVDGVDALFIGPSDLSASLGHLGNPKAVPVRSVIEDAFLRINKTGKASGFLSSDQSDCKWAIDQGCNLLAIGSDLGIFATTSRNLSKYYRDYLSSVSQLPEKR